MKNLYIAFGLLTVISLQGCVSSSAEPVASARADLSQSTTGDAVKKETIEVASKEMVVSAEGLRNQEPIVCQLSSGRLVVHADGTEYVISGNDDILGTRRIPLGTRGGKEWVKSNIDKSAAIELTKADATSVYTSIDKFKISACELPAVWRVVYELNGEVSGGGPDYVVDKRNGQIIYKKYNQ